MNIFRREMKANLKGLILWCIGILFMIAGGMGKYAGFEASGQSAADLTKLMPPELLSFFGLGSLGLDTITGFYAIVYFCIVLMAAIHAGMLGAGIISKEERDRTSEFLYVKPVSREYIITFKILAAIANIVLLNLISLVTSLMVVDQLNTGEDFSSDIILLMLAMLILQIMFLFVGTGLAAISKKPLKAASRVTAIILAAYLLDVAVNINNDLSWLTFLSPFLYFEAETLMDIHHLPVPYVLLSMGIICATLFMTYRFYKRKDLTI